MAGLKFTLILCVVPIMLISGIYAYRFLNNKLKSSSGNWGLIFYASPYSAPWQLYMAELNSNSFTLRLSLDLTYL